MNFDSALKISKGNQDAALFLCSWDAFCGMFDDVYDEPDTVNDAKMVAATLAFLSDLMRPGWVRDNSPRLYPVVALSLNAWLDANQMAKSDSQRDRLASDVVKAQYQEMIFAVADLCGGHDHMRTISREFRKYDYDIPIELPDFKERLHDLMVTSNGEAR